MPDASAAHAGDLALIETAARQAADIAQSYFGRDPKVWYKNGGRSPVSEADMAVDTHLRRALFEARPGTGWLSEETADTSDRLSQDDVFIADPIDGTRAFIGARSGWCVSVALVHGGVPVAGVLAAPARNETWTAARGAGAFLNGVRLPVAGGHDDGRPLRTALPDKLAASRALLAEARIERIAGGPSLALRLAAIADGSIDAVVVRPRSNEWDLAAAHLILSETGHRLTGLDGVEVVYNQPDPSRGLLLAGAPQSIHRLMALVQRSGIDL